MNNQMNNHEAPHSIDVFKIVEVVRIDGKSTCVPVQIMDESTPAPAFSGKVLHIVVSKSAFCAWRSN